MARNNWIMPALVVLGAAAVGRYFGFRNLMRGTMEALALRGDGLTALPAEAGRKRPRRKAVSRTARHKAPVRRSTPAPG
jgi:hypothetical protein